MSNQINLNASRNNALVPGAQAKMDNMKFEIAQELGVPLTQGYNGNLTARQAGSVGGEMVKRMIASVEQSMSGGSKF